MNSLTMRKPYYICDLVLPQFNYDTLEQVTGTRNSKLKSMRQQGSVYTLTVDHQFVDGNITLCCTIESEQLDSISCTYHALVKHIHGLDPKASVSPNWLNE